MSGIIQPNQQTSQTQRQEPSPQQLAAFQILSRFFLNQMGQGPDSFAAFRQRGNTARPYPGITMSAGEAQFIDPNAIDPKILEMVNFHTPAGGKSTWQWGAQNPDPSQGTHPYLQRVPADQGGTAGRWRDINDTTWSRPNAPPEQQRQLMAMLSGGR